MSAWSDLTPDNCRVVVVEWDDITAVESWNEEEMVEATRVHTVGWMLEDSPQRLVIASSWRSDGWAEFNVFPRSPIRSVR